jgi:hypothetical protein
MLRRVLSYKFTDISLITLMMKAVSTCETLVNFYESTWRNIQEDSHLNTHRRENQKSHKLLGARF